jgi:predicted metal-binding protein
MNFVRVWKELDTEEVEKQLLLVEDLYGTCANCKKLGLNYLKDKSCPSCNTTFKYIATTLKNPADISKLLNRMKTSNINLILIERDDYKKAQAKDALKDLFKS